MNTSDLVKSASVAHLANQRIGVVERVRRALILLSEAEQLANAAHLGFPRLVLDESYACRGKPTVTGECADRADAESAIVRIIDRHGWNYLLSESGLRTFMDARAREQWSAQIAKGYVPELTAANIESTFDQLYRSRLDMFERGVLECFKRLSWSYKTNQPFKFGKRIIVRYLFRDGCPNCRVTDELDDLIRVFCLLDGKPEPDHRHGTHVLVSDAKRERHTETENAYFHLRWPKNGNGHLTFKRPDLVNNLNMILAKHYPNALAAQTQ